MEDLECAGLLDWASSAGITDAAPLTSAVRGRSLGACLRVACFPLAGGRGLAAVRDIEEGEMILRVPDGALMNVRTAREDPVLATAVLRHPRMSSEQILTVHLLREVSKKSESRWWPYLLHLPRVHHSLSHFSDEEAEALQVEDAVWTAKRSARRVRESWAEAQGLLREVGLREKLASFKAWLWASATISSRTLHVPWDPAGTLCPVGDLFNYAAPGAATVPKPRRREDPERAAGRANSNDEEEQEEALGSEAAGGGLELDDDDDDGDGVELKDRLRDGGYEPEHQAFCFYARQAYTDGQQVLLCYGQYTNLELLEHYGFLLPDNPNDTVPIAVTCSSAAADPGNSYNDDSGGGGALARVQQQPDQHQQQLYYIHVNGRPSFSLLASLRLRAASPAQRKSRGHLARSGVQVSVEGDLWVYRWLLDRCRALLAELPTQVTDDAALLNAICSSRGVDGEENVSLDRGSTRAREELDMLSRSLRDEGSSEVTRRSRLERWKMAVQWRIGYKQVLHACMSYSGKKLHQLQARRTGGGAQVSW